MKTTIPIKPAQSRRAWIDGREVLIIATDLQWFCIDTFIEVAHCCDVRWN